MLQHVAIYVTTCCNMLQHMLQHATTCCNMLQHMLQHIETYVAPCCNMLQYMLQHVARCCNILQHVAALLRNNYSRGFTLKRYLTGVKYRSHSHLISSIPDLWKLLPFISLFSLFVFVQVALV